jgi:hypothetical protein
MMFAYNTSDIAVPFAVSSLIIRYRQHKDIKYIAGKYTITWLIPMRTIHETSISYDIVIYNSEQTGDPT